VSWFIGVRVRGWNTLSSRTLRASVFFSSQLANPTEKVGPVLGLGRLTAFLADGTIPLWPDPGAGSRAAFFSDLLKKGRPILLFHRLASTLGLLRADSWSAFALSHDSWPPIRVE
jgi:hypothetical protein